MRCLIMHGLGAVKEIGDGTYMIYRDILIIGPGEGNDWLEQLLAYWTYTP